MKQNFIFASILLAAFSINSVTPQTNYQPCALTPQPPTFGVKATPDPIVPGGPVTYALTGAGGKEVPKGKLAIQWADRTGKVINEEVVASGATAKGNAPGDLPKEFRNALIITDDAKTVVACAVADGTAAEAAKGKDAKGKDAKGKDAKGKDGGAGDGAKGPGAKDGGAGDGAKGKDGGAGDGAKGPGAKDGGAGDGAKGPGAAKDGGAGDGKGPGAAKDGGAGDGDGDDGDGQ